MRSEYDKRLDRRKEVSNRISETVRFIGYGLVAAFYAMQVDSNLTFQPTISQYEVLFMAIGLFGVLAVVSDYSQYLFSYLSTVNALKRRDANFKFNSKSFSYQMMLRMFWVKQFFAGGGAICLITLIVLNFYLA